MWNDLFSFCCNIFCEFINNVTFYVSFSFFSSFLCTTGAQLGDALAKGASSNCPKPEELSPVWWHVVYSHVFDHLRIGIFYVTVDLKLKGRPNIKLHLKLGKSVKEALEMLDKAYSCESMRRVKCFEWYSHFKRGCTSQEDDMQSG